MLTRNSYSRIPRTKRAPPRPSLLSAMGHPTVCRPRCRRGLLSPDVRLPPLLLPDGRARAARSAGRPAPWRWWQRRSSAHCRRSLTESRLENKHATELNAGGATRLRRIVEREGASRRTKAEIIMFDVASQATHKSWVRRACGERKGGRMPSERRRKSGSSSTLSAWCLQCHHSLLVTVWLQHSQRGSALKKGRGAAGRSARYA